MSLEIMQMWTLITGGAQNGAAVIDIPSNGTIWGVDWAAAALLNADGEFFYAELSFVATGQPQANDVRGIVSAIRQRIHLLTSGVGTTGVNKYVQFGTGLRAAGGERLFMNIDASAGLTGNVNVYIHFDPSAGAPARRSARRR